MSSSADNYANARTEFQYFAHAVDRRVGSWKLAFEQISASFIDAYDDVTAALAGHEKRQSLLDQVLRTVVYTVLPPGTLWLLQVGALARPLGETLVVNGGMLGAIAAHWPGLTAAPNFGSKDSFVMSLRLRQVELENRRSEVVQRMLADQFMGDNQAGSARWDNFRPGQMLEQCRIWLASSKEFRGAAGLPPVSAMAKEFARGFWAKIGAHRWGLGVLAKLLDRIPKRVLLKMKEADIPVDSFHQSVMRGPTPGGEMMLPPDEWWSMSEFSQWARAYRPVDFLKLADLMGRVEQIDLPPVPAIGAPAGAPGQGASTVREMQNILTFIGNRPANTDTFLNLVRGDVADGMQGGNVSWTFS